MAARTARRIMKTIALIANSALLVVMAWYLLTIETFQAEGLELLCLILALTAPILSILALVVRRSTRGATTRQTGAPFSSR